MSPSFTRPDRLPSVADIRLALRPIVLELKQHSARRDLERELPYAAFDQLRQIGLGSVRLPERLGGPGGSVKDYAEILVDLASGDPNVAHALRSHFNFTEALVHAPPSEQREWQLEQVRRGRLFAGAHTEVGAPLGILRTRLRRDGAGYRLDGKKWYATGSIYADWLTVSAVDDAGEMVNVLLPRERPGIEVFDDWDGMGQRLTASGSLTLANVEVHPNEVCMRGADPAISRHCSTLRQLHLAACAVGAIHAIRDDALDYVRRAARAAMHSPADTAAEDGFVQQVVGEIAADGFAADTLIARVANLLDLTSATLLTGDAAASETALLAAAAGNAQMQIVIGRLAQHAAQAIFDTGGGSATSRVYNFDRHWRNIRTVLNHNPLLHKARVIGDYLINQNTTHLKEGLVF